MFFFDTPDLALDKQGLVVRARRSQGKGDDSVVKLRPVVPAELPKAVRRSPTFGVEVDASPAGYVCSGSLKGTPRRGDVWDVAAGKKRIRKLFSKEQRALYEAHAPEGLALDDLAVLGPILVLKLKRTPKGFGRPLVAEVWALPGRVAHPRALDEVRAAPGVRGRGRGAGVPRRARGRAQRRAGDEDADGARVLRGTARSRAVSARPRGGSATRTAARTRR